MFPSPAKADQNFKTVKNQILQSLKNYKAHQSKQSIKEILPKYKKKEFLYAFS